MLNYQRVSHTFFADWDPILRDTRPRALPEQPSLREPWRGTTLAWADLGVAAQSDGGS